MKTIYNVGMDIGSTTAKIVIINSKGNVIYSSYVRHQAKIKETVIEIMNNVFSKMGNIDMSITVTGSAGLGLSENYNFSFVQEVTAAASYLKINYPETGCYIEIGGEDSKIIFFDEYGNPDIRMNGACAGGTGAFIDQMAVLLGTDIQGLDKLAEQADKIYPIASRCGVFAKTDIQTLLSRNIMKEEIAASIYNATAVQVISSLSRGNSINGKIVFGGGPLTFCSGLRKAFKTHLNKQDTDNIILPEHPELIPATGAALIQKSTAEISDLETILYSLKNNKIVITNHGNLKPLFTSKRDFDRWKFRHSQYSIPKCSAGKEKPEKMFLGIDSGSTTTKLVLIDNKGRIIFSDYRNNSGNAVGAVKEGLNELKRKANELGIKIKICRSATTGYGENIIRAAFNIQDSIVETMAHYKAASFFEPEVSFILDIGGQDMKAIFINNYAVSDIQINEACSSGCGSFLQTFSESLGYRIEDFAQEGCRACHPFDLGIRCTVFMNSRVKQAFREGANVSEISAGLAYSVIQNVLYKVLKLKNTDLLGNKIIVQGGTFKNPAVLRALEIILGKEVIAPNIPELMGAYGAALKASENYNEYLFDSSISNHVDEYFSFQPDAESDNTTLSIEELVSDEKICKNKTVCKGCGNNCTVYKTIFSNGRSFYTGNRCERCFSNNGERVKKGKNLISKQMKLLFDRQTEPESEPILTFGIPRCLNIYENYPFWCTFLTGCGFRVVLSSASDFKMFETGSNTIMSENICFPARVAHGHIFDLSKKNIDRIFYPTVVYEKNEFNNENNTYNCPVITGYPDLLKNSVNPEKRFNIPLDNPAVSFRDITLLKKQLTVYFKKYGINAKTIKQNVDKGLIAQAEYKEKVKISAKKMIKESTLNGETTIVIAGRPYHMDPLVNHGIPELLTGLGVNVISESAIPLETTDTLLKNVNVLTQWSYTNRLYAAAEWVSEQNNLHLVQLSSFGCGPDAISSDEVRSILHRKGKLYTLVKIDENANLEAIKIRLKSMLESIERRNDSESYTRPYLKKQKQGNKPDKEWTFIAPHFSPFYSPLIPSIFRSLGYNIEILPPQDDISVNSGLKMVNNDICYPAMLICGDICKALKSGKYNIEKTAVIITSTEGQCRASSYFSLIKKGLRSEGFKDVPVIPLSINNIGESYLDCIEKIKLVKRAALGILFSDALARIYLASVVREKQKGQSKLLHKKYLSLFEDGIEEINFNYLIDLLASAVEDFNRIEVNNKIIPRIGIVGEIFVKYNYFAGSHIIDWLIDRGIEVGLPPIQNFFFQRFINEAYNQQTYFKRSIQDRIKNSLYDIYSKHHINKIESIMKNYRFYRAPQDLGELSEITGDLITLANQYGEGWLLTAEIISMLRENTNNIICLQPFGCIANHITGKGMEKKLKELFPQMNMLSLDMDAGISEVNIHNRLHIMLEQTRLNSWITLPALEQEIPSESFQSSVS